MKLPTLLLASLAAASVQAGLRYSVLYCQARIMEDNGDDYLSVELPATSGYVDGDGNPVAVWKIGTVAAGGAIDTFYSENGPGAFQVRNTGNRNAYIYITTGEFLYHDDHTPSSYSQWYHDNLITLFGDEIETIWAVANPVGRVVSNYCLAVSTAVSARVPEWRNLSWGYTWGDPPWMKFDKTEDMWNYGSGMFGQYLGYALAGEVIPFDLKFYAPIMSNGYPVVFIVRLEASTFRRWDHDK